MKTFTTNIICLLIAFLMVVQLPAFLNEHMASAFEGDVVVEFTPAPDASVYPSALETEPTIDYLDVESGVFTQQFTADNGLKVSYNIYIPENATTDMPLIVWLHGQGYLNKKLPQDYGVIKMAREQCEDRFIIVQPMASYGWHVEKQFNAILDLTNYIVSEYQMDTDRVILTGHSLGSLGAWYYAENATERWAAVVPVSNRCTNRVDNLLESNLTIWAFCSNWDTYENITGTQKTVDTLKNSNPDRDIQYTIMEGYNHNDMAEAPYTIEFFNWAADQNR